MKIILSKKPLSQKKYQEHRKEMTFKNVLTATLMSLICLSTASTAADYSMPSEQWAFMEGYKYEYPNCNVSWAVKTSTFITNGYACDSITPQRMQRDALVSIDYVKKHSNVSNFKTYYSIIEYAKKSYSIYDANQDARIIWATGCTNFKNGLNEGNFVKWLNLDDHIKKYSRIKRIPVIKLYMDGWDTARLLNGVVNCNELAPYRAEDYVSGIDIRNTN
ncbi:hypothetical protein [Pseudomonas fragi]|uniref:hypothetical protein n=1 Tax=Pseudomonas fragi TaxID=296 RepID=UPI00114021FC|nr:hypothetical protein [Pseudomonas fragi]